MKFTEALLLGSMNSQQAFHMNREDEPGRCALETAIEANGGDIRLAFGWQAANDMWPWLRTQVDMECPCGSNCSLSVRNMIFEVIYHLNDNHRWPRPRIAEWARQYELMYDPEPVVKPIAEEVCNETK